MRGGNPPPQAVKPDALRAGRRRLRPVPQQDPKARAEPQPTPEAPTALPRVEEASLQTHSLLPSNAPPPEIEGLAGKGNHRAWRGHYYRGGEEGDDGSSRTASAEIVRACVRMRGWMSSSASTRS